MDHEMGGTNGQGNLVPLPVSQPVGEGLGARLPFETVMVANLLPHSTAFQLKVAADKKKSEMGLSDFRG